MNQPEIHLHLGAHKTASSHLQKSLRQNPGVLSAAGASFLPPQHYRRTLAPLQLSLRDGAERSDVQAQAAMLVLGAAEGAGRLILSDENILGNLPRVAKDDRLYPWARGRVARSVTVLGPRKVRLYVSIRHVGDWLTSAYSESLLHKPFRSFEAFRATMAPDRLRWSTLAQDLLVAAPKADLVVWRQEDYPQLQHRVVEQMIGTPCPEDFVFLDSHPRPGLSARAIQALAQWANDGRSTQNDGLVAHARDLFPKGDDFPAPEHFSGTERAVLDDTYAQDFIELHKLSRVTVLDAETES